MPDHPYRSLPDRSFWSRSVVRNFAVEAVPNVPTLFLNPHDSFMSAGSCFAANIARYLKTWGYEYVVTERAHPQWPEGRETGFYDAYSACYGNIYTARQMLQLLQRSAGILCPEEEYWVDPAGGLTDPFRPGLIHKARTPLEFRSLTSQHLRAVRAAIDGASVLIFTLGLTEAWVSLDGSVFPACPGTVSGEFDPSRHRFKNFTVAEVVADLGEMIRLAREFNPQLRIILTVSPVPLVATATDKHVLAATTYSKAVLRVAAEECVSMLPDVAYFPAYEIVTGPHHAASPFEADLRSVREPVVTAAMDSFHQVFFGTNPPGPSSDRADPDLLTQGIEGALAAECEEMMADEQLKLGVPVDPRGAVS